MKKSNIFAICIIGLSVVGVSAYFLTKDSQSTDNTSQKSPTGIYSIEGVDKHSTASDCWTIISGNVYNLSEYIPAHSGGAEIVRACDIDSTSLFTKRQTTIGESVGAGAAHFNTAKSDLSTLQIGTLAN